MEKEDQWGEDHLDLQIQNGVVAKGSLTVACQVEEVMHHVNRKERVVYNNKTLCVQTNQFVFFFVQVVVYFIFYKTNRKLYSIEYKLPYNSYYMYHVGKHIL